MTTRARRTWRYRLINELHAREITFAKPVVKKHVLDYLTAQHKQLVAEIWNR